MRPLGIELWTWRFWPGRHSISTIQPLLWRFFNLPIKYLSILQNCIRNLFWKTFSHFFGTGALAPVPKTRGNRSIFVNSVLKVFPGFWTKTLDSECHMRYFPNIEFFYFISGNFKCQIYRTYFKQIGDLIQKDQFWLGLLYTAIPHWKHQFSSDHWS